MLRLDDFNKASRLGPEILCIRVEIRCPSVPDPDLEAHQVELEYSLLDNGSLELDQVAFLTWRTNPEDALILSADEADELHFLLGDVLDVSDELQDKLNTAFRDDLAASAAHTEAN